MEIVFIVLTCQIVVGGFDNLWHHEITERLPCKRSARGELALHAAREFLYAVFFVAIAWSEWRGAWAGVLAGLLVVEIGITLADFLVEDLTRRLPPLERVLHTVLAINVGVLLAVLAPVLWHWSSLPTAVATVDYGLWSWFFTLSGLSVFVWSIRNAVAVVHLMRPLLWQRYPVASAPAAEARTALITGATGFIGTCVTRRLLAGGYRVVVLTRDSAKAAERFGPPVRIVESLDSIDEDDRIDIVVNLAGAPIADRLWTRQRKLALVRSRLAVTRSLTRLIERLSVKPAVMVSASAVGYYGVSESRRCSEETAAGKDFAARLCRAWERVATRAEGYGTRVCRLRIGLVLGRHGGVLPRLALAARLGVRLIMGSGRQWMSWIHVDDLTRLILFLVENDSLRGAFNATAPAPVRHEEFMRTIGRALNARLPLRIPSALISAAAGEMATLFLDGQDVRPAKALAAGFRFEFEKIDAALGDLLADAAYEGVPSPLPAWRNARRTARRAS